MTNPTLQLSPGCPLFDDGSHRLETVSVPAGVYGHGSPAMVNGVCIVCGEVVRDVEGN